MKNPKYLLAAWAIAATMVAPSFARAHNVDSLPDYRALPPAVKARVLPVDPKKGYLVKELQPNVYMITDGGYQSLFLTTGQGVVLLDAPPSTADHIVEAVTEVTKEPIKVLVYSHTHLDHISGAPVILKHAPGLKIIAEQGTADFLREKSDPRRPIPTQVFRGHYTLKLGTAVVEMTLGHWHDNAGDLYIYLPRTKTLMAIDTLPPGYAQFMDFDLTSDFRDYLGMFDKVLAYDFDDFIGGHLGIVGNRADVERARDYTFDVYRTVKRIHDGTDQMAVVTRAAAKYTWDNKMALFRTMLDGIVDQCTKEIESRWSDKLASVDVYAATHCHTALIYARWDD